MPLPSPVAKLDARFLPYISVQFTNQSGSFEQVNEFKRWNQPAFRMNPTHQSLPTMHRSIHRCLRLDIKAKLSAIQRILKLSDNVLLPECNLKKCFIIINHTACCIILNRLECHNCPVAHNRNRCFKIIHFIDSHVDAQTEICIFLYPLNPGYFLSEYAFLEKFLRQTYCKTVSGQSSIYASGRGLLSKAFSLLPDDFITFLFPINIVHYLKITNITTDNIINRVFILLHKLLRTFIEIFPVIKPCQGIMVCLVTFLFYTFHFFRSVVHNEKASNLTIFID